MLASFPYMAMTITGVLHLLFGIVLFINTMVGFKKFSDNKVDAFNNLHIKDDVFGSNREYLYNVYDNTLHIYLGIVTGSSLWVLIVGVFGILAGVKTMEHSKTNCYKITYMVMAILSAIIFAPVGTIVAVFINFNMQPIGVVGGLFSFAEFVLAIVSSSICCCCSNSAVPITGVVFQHTAAPPNVVNVQTYPQGYPQAYPQGYPQTYAPPPTDQGFTNPGYGVSGPTNEKV